MQIYALIYADGTGSGCVVLDLSASLMWRISAASSQVGSGSSDRKLTEAVCKIKETGAVYLSAHGQLR